MRVESVRGGGRKAPSGLFLNAARGRAHPVRKNALNRLYSLQPLQGLDQHGVDRVTVPAEHSITARLADLAKEARHHPQPAVAVALLSQLLLDVVVELQPLAQRYALVLKASGFLANLERSVESAALQLAATGGTRPDPFDVHQDTTGTAA